MACEWTTKHCKNTLTLFNILAGGYLIANGVLNFIWGTDMQFKKSLLSIYYMYTTLTKIIRHYHNCYRI